MAYLGNSPVLSQQEYRNIDNISGSFNGVTTSFPLLVNGVAPVPAPQSSNQCLISVNGVVQKPDDTGASGFRLSSGNIVFSAAPTGGQSFFGVILAGADYIYAGSNFPDGTVSAPSITFAQDLDTGFYRSGAGEVKFTANGANVVTLSANNLTAPSFIPTGSSAPSNGVYLPSANNVAISTNGTGRLFVNSIGQVGVGKVPVQLFDAEAAGNAQVRVTTTDTSGGNIGSFVGRYTGGGGGTASTVVLRAGDGYTSVGASTNSPLVFINNETERMRLDTSGRLGLGTSSPNWLLQVAGNAAVIQEDSFLGVDATTSPRLGIVKKSGASPVFAAGSATAITFSHSSASDITGVSSNTYTPRLTIDSSGRVGIGTTSPSSYATGYNDLVVGNHTGNHGITIASQNTATGRIEFADGTGATEVDVGEILYNHANNSLSISTNRSTALTVDSSQRLLVGTSSALTGTDTQYSRMVVTGNTSGASAAIMSLSRPEAATSITTDEVLGLISFADNGAGEYARITCAADANAGSGDYPGRLVFSTTADGASSPTERMRIDRDGNLHIAKTTGSLNTVGYTFYSAGLAEFVRSGGTVLNINRLASDGGLVDFYQDSALEGNISVSGSTVFFNGAHLARWSQLANGAQRVDILRGSVLSNLDEMCEWGEEANEQLNRMKISDVDEDPNVAGVFISWDDDDDTYTDDFYCAMTGDFIIRIAEGVTVQRGDLLMSAGDGTAKPQDDDIIRSKTVAKVTSTHVTCTYDDGSYCVPCVLMAC
jgi:hypothetical protein